jgi:mannose-6-phosphate isomerase-like protein (cupin superfamily)
MLKILFENFYINLHVVIYFTQFENFVIIFCISYCVENEFKNMENNKITENSSYENLNKVIRPWGYYINLVAEKKTLTKVICVHPKQRLSLQSHNFRSEHWIVIEGKGVVILGEDKYELSIGQCIDIPLKSKHSLQNPYNTDLKIIEVQMGEYLSEDDIIRYEDIYGRV